MHTLNMAELSLRAAEVTQDLNAAFRLIDEACNLVGIVTPDLHDRTIEAIHYEARRIRAEMGKSGHADGVA